MDFYHAVSSAIVRERERERGLIKEAFVHHICPLSFPETMDSNEGANNTDMEAPGPETNSSTKSKPAFIWKLHEHLPPTLLRKALGISNTSLVCFPFDRMPTIGNFTIEERKQKLSRYRKKKSKRNFGRKIKYACRKALADNQPRVRGRFAKTEEAQVSRVLK